MTWRSAELDLGRNLQRQLRVQGFENRRSREPTLSSTGGCNDGKIDYSAADGSIPTSASSSSWFRSWRRCMARRRSSARVYGLAEDPHFKATVGADGLDIRIASIEQLFEDTRFKVDWNDSLARSCTSIGREARQRHDGGRRHDQACIYDKVPDP